MRKTNVRGIALDLKHDHFTATQYDLLSFYESLLKSCLGTTEQATQTPAKILTSILSYSNGTLYWTDGWCVINGKVRRVFAGTTEIIQTGNRTYYFEASDNEIGSYNYKKLNEETLQIGCTEQTVVVTSDDTGFHGFDVENKITICGYKTNVYESSVITEFANRYYNFSRVNDKNNQRVSQVLDGISSFRRKNGASVQTFYVEVNNWNMQTDASKTISYPPHIYLEESNVSVMSHSFSWVNDINTLCRNDDYTISFGQNACTINRPGLEGALYSGTGFRGVLKIEAYTYCHIPS
jgi:hypothetical protein